MKYSINFSEYGTFPIILLFDLNLQERNIETKYIRYCFNKVRELCLNNKYITEDHRTNWEHKKMLHNSKQKVYHGVVKCFNFSKKG